MRQFKSLLTDLDLSVDFIFNYEERTTQYAISTYTTIQLLNNAV